MELRERFPRLALKHGERICARQVRASCNDEINFRKIVAGGNDERAAVSVRRIDRDAQRDVLALGRLSDWRVHRDVSADRGELANSQHGV